MIHGIIFGLRGYYHGSIWGRAARGVCRRGPMLFDHHKSAARLMLDYPMGYHPGSRSVHTQEWERMRRGKCSLPDHGWTFTARRIEDLLGPDR